MNFYVFHYNGIADVTAIDMDPKCKIEFGSFDYRIKDLIVQHGKNLEWIDLLIGYWLIQIYIFIVKPLNKRLIYLEGPLVKIICEKQK